ncbi:DUF3299 domain-containing protein [Chitinophaga deserti]|uniref:DUF3299 domain-containing protein n=1 Tax=Chitinophaga deserti TaxID=2164099 RepID=UPI000D6D6323|nr:DUF3299 domain-containing protein [Chitinophaga deserti]
MLKVEKITLAAVAIFLVSCSDISQVCRHSLAAAPWMKQIVSARASASESLPVSTVTVALRNEAPLKVTWKQLSDVIFTRKYDEKMKMPMLYPSFSRSIKALNGKAVEISGYMVPVDAKGGVYVLSANPNSSCFFCGGAGPETVMTLNFKSKKPDFETDDYIKATGILRLNEKNIYEMYYNLDNAEVTDK